MVLLYKVTSHRSMKGLQLFLGNVLVPLEASRGVAVSILMLKKLKINMFKMDFLLMIIELLRFLACS